MSFLLFRSPSTVMTRLHCCQRLISSQVQSRLAWTTLPRTTLQSTQQPPSLVAAYPTTSNTTWQRCFSSTLIVSTHSRALTVNNNNLVSNLDYSLLFSRSLATTSQKKNKKLQQQRAKRLKTKQQSRSSPPSGAPPEKKIVTTAAQHEEWVRFQQSIAVTGFDTGQTVAPVAAKPSSARVKKLRRQREDERQDRLAKQRRLTAVGGGHYPPMRYSDEETERLLAQAYAAIPARGGKRGTRNLRRQSNRWHRVRQIREKYKYHLAQFHLRRMAKRSQKIKSVKEALAEAPVIREQDRLYQAQVYERWLQNMVQDQENKVVSSEL